MQLVAYGMQDVYLTGNSQITFFKNLYRRHTNYACEAVEQTFQSNSTSFGNKLVAVISRNGDLLHRLWLEVTLEGEKNGAHNSGTGVTKPDTCYVSKLGHALIKSAEVEIGGQRIDKTYGRFTHLWHKLSCKAEKEAGYELMTANDGPDKKVSTGASDPADPTTSDLITDQRKLYLPINFWFSKGSAGAALPLIALQYHEVRISIELAEKEFIQRMAEQDGVSKSVGTALSTDATAFATVISDMAEQPRLYSDFFYLDTDERRRFSQMSHEYLIEQLQFTGQEQTGTIDSTTSVPFSTRLNFNHPTKAIYWTTESSFEEKDRANPFYNGWSPSEPETMKSAVADGEFGKYHNNSPIEEVQLQLNGHERFSVRDGEYFQLVQPYQHHTRVPYDHWVGMYSFCLSPEEHQPSGALNFSRIDNASLKLKFKGKAKSTDTTHTRTVYVYAVSYNVLRILSGMGGLAFSN